MFAIIIIIESIIMITAQGVVVKRPTGIVSLIIQINDETAKIIEYGGKRQ